MTGDDMNKPIMRPVKPEEDVEAAVANALEGLKVEQPGQPMAYQDDRQRDLIPRSRDSFKNHLAQLQDRVDSVNVKILESIRARDDAIHEAEKHHASRMRELERDIYEIKTLRGAVELALIALGEYDQK
jgi:phosphate uptake regulator